MPRRRRRPLLTLVGGLALAGLTYASFSVPTDSVASVPVEVQGPVVSKVPTPAPSYDAVVVPTPEPVPTRSEEVAGSGRLRIPGLSFDVPLLTMPVTDGVVDPPTFSDAYLIEGYGTPQGAGTTYVALHSGRGIDAVGNSLIDIDSGRSTVGVGELLVVDSVSYVVTSVEMVDKVAVTAQPDLWTPVDGRLVVFTCLQRQTGTSVQNVVIIGERVS